MEIQMISLSRERISGILSKEKIEPKLKKIEITQIPNEYFLYHVVHGTQVFRINALFLKEGEDQSIVEMLQRTFPSIVSLSYQNAETLPS